MLDYDLSKHTSAYEQSTYQHLVSANTVSAFDFAQTTPAAGLSSSERQAVARGAMTRWFLA